MTSAALVTGATSGIGKAIAQKLAATGNNLILTGRRKERLEKISREIQAQYNCEVHALAFDIRDYSAVQESLLQIPSHIQIDVLVNNAGLALGLSDIHEGDVAQWDQMIDTNIKGLLYMTREVAPKMAAREKGHIVNIGSLAGKEVYEKGNVYCATKHAVDALGKAMRTDLVKYGIKVTTIHPGLAETEFSIVRFSGDKEKAGKVYEGYQPLSAEDVADAVHYAISCPPHVNINDLLITPTAQGHSKLVIKK